MLKQIMSLLIVFASVTPVSTVHAAGLHVAVADSMCAVMKSTGEAFSKQSAIPVGFTCKSSGLLFKGMRAGVIKADFYISANRQWMDRAVNAGLIDQNEVTSPWGNTLVVAARRTSPLVMHSLDDLTADTIKKVIIGDPGKAPFGRYAKQTLENARLWDTVKQKTVSREKISLAIALLEGEESSTVAFLYASNLTKNLRAVFVIPETGHDRIHYFVAPLKPAAAGSDMEGRAEFMAFLRNRETSQRLQEAGFVVFDHDAAN